MSFLPGMFPAGAIAAAAALPSPQSWSFDGTDDVLTHVYGSSAADAQRRTWTLSYWAKSPTVGSGTTANDAVGQVANSGNTAFDFWSVAVGSATSTARVPALNLQGTSNENPSASSGVLADAWHHWVFRVDTANATADDRIRFYQNGTLLTDTGTNPALDLITQMFQSGATLQLGAYLDISSFAQYDMAFLDLVSGSSLDPTSFAFDDAGTWTARHPATLGSWGTHGCRLDGTDGFNDVSGNGLNFTNTGGVTLNPSALPPYAA